MNLNLFVLFSKICVGSSEVHKTGTVGYDVMILPLITLQRTNLILKATCDNQAKQDKNHQTFSKDSYRFALND